MCDFVEINADVHCNQSDNMFALPAERSQEAPKQVNFGRRVR
jgi:hypothetical protein